MSDRGEEEQDFCDTADENQNLVDVYDKYGLVDSFLKRNETVYARGIVLEGTEIDVFLDFEFDIDGCVVEVRDLGEISLKVRHLSFFPRGKIDLRNIYPFLKKHLDLTKFSDIEIHTIRKSIGFQLFYEYGWECWIGLIPIHKRKSVELTGEVLRRISVDTFEMLKLKIRIKLLAARLRGMGTKSMAKNDLSDLDKLTILPDDSQFFLKTVQEVLSTHQNSTLRLICFCFRFGEKISGELSLAEFGKDNISSATVHAAVNISCDSGVGIDLLWSRDGVQNVCGRRGTLSTCLSFVDCVNYQSNLDGRVIGISSELRNLSSFGRELRFVQLYADIPHCLPKARYHPVSGSIAVGVCAHTATMKTLSKEADRYISTLEGNLIGTRGSKCRLEFVTEIFDFSDVLVARDYFDVENLRTLLERRAMIVPFSHTVLTCVRQVGFWAINELQNLHKEFQNTGNVNAIWCSYQLELMLEKLVWGRPLCWRSKQNSINLGPGALHPSRSNTDSFGFMELESSTCCMSKDDEIPVVSIWTNSEAFGKLIERCVGFHDHIDSSPIVLGRRLVYVLLQDLCTENVMCRFNDFFAALKSENSTLQVVGIMTLSGITKILSEPRKVSKGMAYGYLWKMLVERGRNVQEYVEAGLKQLDLKLFPAIETVDSSRNEVLKWNKARKFWRIIEGGRVTDDLECTTALCDIIKSEIERRGLIYPSRIKKAPVSLPWIPICRQKLARLNLSEEERISALAFISCVAFMMEGWYVEYSKLAGLIQDLPISQHRMKDLEILSKLTLSGCNKLKVFRLHETIPHRIDVPEKKRQVNINFNLKEEKKNVNDEVDVFAKENTVSNRIPENLETMAQNESEVAPRNITCQSANRRSYQMWSVEELDIIDELKRKHKETPMREVFSEYKAVCVEKNIPFRTFNVFKCRLLRGKNSKLLK